MKTLLITLTTGVALAGDQIPHETISQDCTSEHHQHDHAPAPIGVMGSHTHEQGEYMFSYRSMFMDMEDNYMGSNKISNREVFSQGYMTSPLDMQMEMHMLGVMYAPTDKLTLMGMLNLVQMEMRLQRNPMMVMMNGGASEFTTKTSGLGDSSISALYQLYQTDKVSIHAGLGVNLPTAETAERDEIINMMGMPQDTILPYPMQLGSGSWGLKPSLTYLGHRGAVSWGLQLEAQFYLDDNENGYRLGDTFGATTWTAYQLSEHLSTSIRLKYSSWGNISGSHQDLSIMPNMVPTADTSLRGGEKLDAYWGLTYQVPNTDFTLSSEVGKTLWQDLDGPQLGSDWNATIGVQVAF